MIELLINQIKFLLTRSLVKNVICDTDVPAGKYNTEKFSHEYCNAFEKKYDNTKVLLITVVATFYKKLHNSISFNTIFQTVQ